MTVEQKAKRLEDPGAHLLDQWTRNWNRYGRFVLIGLGVLAIAGLGVLLTARARAQAENEASGKLAEANFLFWQRDFTRSLQSAKQVYEQWPNSASGLDAHRIAGDDLFWNAKYKDAAAEYRLYLAKQKEGIVADAVRRSLAYTLESDQQYQEAAALYDGLAGKFDRESSAEFLFAAARCYRQLNQPQEALKRLERIVNEFGDTSYLVRARIAKGELAPGSN